MASWNQKKGYLKRSTGTMGTPRPSILIVCEGERTEPLYFEAFKVSSVDIKIVGTGFNTDTLVEFAIERKKASQGDPYDQIWCVFDRDSFPAQNFNRALQLAKTNDIKVAYTNEAFELWYLLHFHFFNTGLSRQQYEEKLSECLGRPYKKNDPKLYNLLLDKRKTAIQNAEKLLTKYSPSDPCNNNPSTEVHLLVKELLKYVF